MDLGFKQTINAADLMNNLGKYLDHVIERFHAIFTFVCDPLHHLLLILYYQMDHGKANAIFTT